ncbi:MAG: membrane protein insertase YidC [Alphaproteobacteria bacterium]|nr:membrane protein insertase YidC [Alphaproteobacteria bacterium]
MKSQDPDNSNNLMLAVVLSLGVLLTWQFFFPPPKPPTAPSQQQAEQTIDGRPAAALQAGAPGAVSGVGPAGAQAGDKDQRVPVVTPSLNGSIALKGARIDDLKLVHYKETTKPDSPDVALFLPTHSRTPYFAEHGWLAPQGSTVKVPDGSSVWSAKEGAELTVQSPLVLTWDNGAGLTFKRTISVDAEFMFTIVDDVTNSSGNDIVLHPYARIYRFGTPKIENFFIQHEGLIGWLGDEDRLQEFGYSEIQEETSPKRFSGINGGWVGFTDKYWGTALIPNQDQPFSAQFWAPTRRGQAQVESFQADIQQLPVTIVSGSTTSVTSRLFAGVKKVEAIEAYEEEFKILEFNYLVDWGWFYFITKPLYYLLHWLNGVFGNFGLAILATTVIVKAAFFPLANRAYASMAQMKKLQPEMEKLKKRHPDDKQKQQQELMALYQKEKINPFAGCFPILLQIPVFFALYKVLFVSIDMRHAPFYGWITDLSAPDPTSLFNLFGLLPYDVPGFLLVGVWPLLMGITMWLQMQLNPSQPDPTQQMIFNWMPVLFTFMLATFPAGLVIYWAWNNVLSLIQQYTIMKRQGVEVPLVDNIKKTFAVVTDLIPKRKSE